MKFQHTVFISLGDKNPTYDSFGIILKDISGYLDGIAGEDTNVYLDKIYVDIGFTVGDTTHVIDAAPMLSAKAAILAIKQGSSNADDLTSGSRANDIDILSAVAGGPYEHKYFARAQPISGYATIDGSGYEYHYTQYRVRGTFIVPKKLRNMLRESEDNVAIPELYVVLAGYVKNDETLRDICGTMEISFSMEAGIFARQWL